MVHSEAAFWTRFCTAGSPSRNETVMLDPLGHLVFLSSPARSWVSASGLLAYHPKHHFSPAVSGSSTAQPAVVSVRREVIEARRQQMLSFFMVASSVE